MSISFHVFARRDRLPSMAQWAQSLHACGIPASPDANAHLQCFSGYLPCPDERVGFELYVEPYSSAHVEFGPDAVDVVGDSDFVLTFRISGRAADLDAAMLAAASVASLSDGILFDSQSRHYIGASSAMDWARREAYHPLAVYRARAQRRRSRHRIAAVLRLLLLLIVAAAFLLLLQNLASLAEAVQTHPSGFSHESLSPGSLCQALTRGLRLYIPPAFRGPAHASPARLACARQHAK